MKLPAPWQSRLYFTILLALLFAVTYLVGYVSHPGPAPAVEWPLVVEPAALDFGTAAVQEDFPWTIPIRNTSAAPISVTDISASCDCSSIEPRSFQIDPGQTVNVQLTLDLLPSATQQELSSWPLSVTLAPLIDRRQIPGFSWTLRGTVSNELKLLPPFVSFAEGLVAGSEFPSRSLVIEYHEPLVRVAVSAQPQLATADVREDPANPRRWHVQLAPDPELPEGPFEFRMAIQCVTVTGEELPLMRRRVRGRVLPDIQAYPPQLYLGYQFIGKPARVSFQVDSFRGDAFSVQRVTPGRDVSDVTILGNDVAAPHNTIALCATPAESGQQRSQVAVRVVTDDGSVRDVTVPILYYAIDQTRAVRVPLGSVVSHDRPPIRGSRP